MIRSFTSAAQFYLLSLLYMRDAAGVESTYNLTNYFAARFKSHKLTPEQNKAINSMASHLNTWARENTLDDIVNDLLVQVSSIGVEADDGEPNHNVQFIDTIIELLGMEFQRNALSGPALDSLRRAVLFPDELRKVKETLERKEWYCTSCNHRFTEGEVLTISTVDRGGNTIHCVKCRNPHFTVCGKDGCAERVPIDQRDLKRLLRTSCSKHREGKADDKGDRDDVNANAVPPRLSRTSTHRTSARLAGMRAGAATTFGGTTVVRPSAAPATHRLFTLDETEDDG